MNVCLSICMEKLCQCSDEGVGMLIGPQALKSLNSIEKIQPRMMVAMFNDNPRTTIICYSPTNASDETNIDTFYNQLSFLVHCIPKHNILISSGNMNSQIGKNVNNKFTSRQIEMGTSNGLHTRKWINMP